MTIVRYFSTPALSKHKNEELLKKLKNKNVNVESLSTEICYHVELSGENTNLNEDERKKLKWILSYPFKPDSLLNFSSFKDLKINQGIIECGPRFNFSTADSSNAVQICQVIGLQNIVRLEKSCRYLLTLLPGVVLNSEASDDLANVLYDRMTQCIYTEENLPLKSFNENLKKANEPWFLVPIIENGKSALEEVNKKLGLAFDDWDLDFYTNMFQKKLKRNPTSVECFDLAQSNSEHSRHWFFKGKLIIDGVECEKSLMQMIMDTQSSSNPNNVIKFSDNSSAIRGFTHKKLVPEAVTGPSKFNINNVDSDIIFTAETHNMPTAVAPFSGATTGTGGRIRDVQAVGRGGHTVAGTAGYCVGNLNIPGFKVPWENEDWEYPYNFASPLEIIIEASNGASDYGNKFGEPVISGFVLSYGLKNVENIREEYVKPVMFSGGIGYMPHDMIEKVKPSKGMLVVKLGGPVYRIGVGGGAASSVAVQGDSERSAALDFGAVQRGDAEMGNRLNRVVRSCMEATTNPIQAIHDQGAGGNGNVLKELVEPEGAVIFTKEFNLGDPTITTMELWGAEYQENNAVLCDKNNQKLLEGICIRERCPVSFVGQVTGDGFVKLVEDSFKNVDLYQNKSQKQNKLPFDLDLEAVLGNMPRKVFDLSNKSIPLRPLSLPANLTVLDALERVFKLVSVGSKRYLTNKVDRCVTGLVAQQQCVGPLHTPLADFAMTALSYFDKVGAATSIGTQPLKGIINPEAGARMAVGEALSNLVFAGITCLSDVKCSGNWMWSGKTGDEGGKLAIACRSMSELMSQLGIAVDGGKDSLSMSAGVKGTRVRSPGTLVVSTYAPCPDITLKVDPSLKNDGSVLVWVPISKKFRMGGSALAQCFQQQGDESPDVDDPEILINVFNSTQILIKKSMILSGHDVSDGGLITCILEMAFAGLRGIEINMNLKDANYIQALFNEELGLVLEISPENLKNCLSIFCDYNVQCYEIGFTSGYGMKSPIKISFNGEVVLISELYKLMRMWEEISYRLELIQANTEYVQQEWNGLEKRTGPIYKVNLDSEITMKRCGTPIRVAVIREEGTNGDREMIASLMRAQFEVYDVTMSDLSNNSITLDRFKGLVFPGGFSYADTLGSAKGWAASILFNNVLQKQFNHFAFARKDTFSLGVCNGCQLMALIGWVGIENNSIDANNLIPQIVLNHNTSERFECRWSCVSINPGKGSDVWFKDMAGSRLGIWVAHGEGQFTFREPKILSELRKNDQICLQYLDDEGNYTEVYPMNPNGSPYGIAGICSIDGRHLAMMPHPERCTITWQCPYPMTPKNNSVNLDSPWQRMFYNAYNWSTKDF